MLSLYLFLAAQQSTLACKKLGIIFTFTPGHKKKVKYAVGGCGGYFF